MIKRFFQTHRTVCLLFAISFIVHLAMSAFLYQQFEKRILFFENEDAHSYLNLAKSLVAGEGFSRDGNPSAYRTPMYPLFLSLFYFLHLPMPWALLIAQNLIASFSGVLLYKLGRMLFSERVGQLAGYIYVLEPYMLMTANLATTETFFNSIIILFAYFFVKFLQNGQVNKNVIYSGVCLGLAALTRPVALYLPIIPVIVSCVYLCIQQKKWKQFFKVSAVIIGVFLCILAPWSARQYWHFGRFKITNIDAFMLYARVSPIVIMDKTKIDYISAAKKQMSLLEKQPGYSDDAITNTFIFYDYMVGETKRLVISHPIPVLRFYLISVIPTLFGTGYEYMLEDVFGIERHGMRPSYTETILRSGLQGLQKIFVSLDIFQMVFFISVTLWVIIYFFIIYTFIHKYAWYGKLAALIFFILMASYFIFFTLGPASHTRYRMPSFPFLYLLFAYSIDFFFKRRILTRVPK